MKAHGQCHPDYTPSSSHTSKAKDNCGRKQFKNVSSTGYIWVESDPINESSKASHLGCGDWLY